jgi:inosine-uridine nucleoside N-ribohydrolase
MRHIALLTFLIPSAVLAADLRDPTPIVITSDCGVDMDDQWAIVHAALAPEIRTLAVIGNFAPKPHNLDSTDTARCIRQALGSAGQLSDIPVYEGANGQLQDPATPNRNRGVDYLIRLSRDFSPERRLVVLGFGPVTDIASAILIDTTIAERIEVVALAFDRYPQGGDGWNVLNDAIAWQVLLDSGIPVTTASGYVALDYLNLKRSEPEAMMGDLGAPGKYLACLHDAWLDAFGKEFAKEIGGNDRWPVWDEAVIAVVLGLTTQRELPRPALNSDLSFVFPNVESHASYRWVDSIDRERLFGSLIGLLEKAKDEGPSRLAAVPYQPTASSSISSSAWHAGCDAGHG